VELLFIHIKKRTKEETADIARKTRPIKTKIISITEYKNYKNKVFIFTKFVPTVAW